MRTSDLNRGWSNFDALGIVVIATWATVAAWYVHRQDSQGLETDPNNRTPVELREGSSWMLLRREGTDVGFVHRRQTRLESGWLVEFDGLVLLELFETDIPLDGELKARLDLEARLEEFDASVRAGRKTVEVQGDVSDGALSLVFNPGDTPQRRTISLQSAPRLLSGSPRALVDRPNLEPGDQIETEYFDPTSMQLRPVTLVSRGRTEIEMLGTRRRAHHVTQRVAGRELDLYVGRNGQLLRQELPLGVSAFHIEAKRARRRRSSLLKRARVARNALAGDRIDRALHRTLSLFGFDAVPGDAPSNDETDAAARSETTTEETPTKPPDATGTSR